MEVYKVEQVLRSKNLLAPITDPKRPQIRRHTEGLDRARSELGRGMEEQHVGVSHDGPVGTQEPRVERDGGRPTEPSSTGPREEYMEMPNRWDRRQVATHCCAIVEMQFVFLWVTLGSLAAPCSHSDACWQGLGGVHFCCERPAAQTQISLASFPTQPLPSSSWP